MAGTATAATHYVAPPPTGHDVPGGGTSTQPWATLGYATDNLAANDTLYIRGGTYRENFSIHTAGVVVAGYAGETVIIDGNFSLPDEASGFTPLVRITANDVEIRDLSITKSAGRGLEIANVANVLVDNVKASYSWHNGIHITGSDHVTVQDCEVWRNVRINENHDAVSWSTGMDAYQSDYTMIRNCVVHENHGENLADWESHHTTLEDNVVWDGLKANIYLNNSTSSTVRRNIVYATDNTDFWRHANETPPRPSPGILVDNETAGVDYSGQQLIVNNFVYQTAGSFILGTFLTGPNDHPTYTDSTIAYNTFFSTRTGGRGVQLTQQDVTNNNFFQNNIVYQTNGTIATGPNAGFSFSNNNWSTTPGTGFSSSATDVSPADPLLQIGSGQHPNSDWLKLGGTSPAINEAQSITAAADDYFGTARGSSPDIGAHESVTSTPPTNLLANPGFETSSSWTNFPSDGAVPAMSPNQHSGTYSVKLWQWGGSYVEVYQQVSVTPGASYQASVWSRTWSSPPGSSRGQMRLQWYQGSTPLEGPIDLTSPAGDAWAKVQSASLAPPAGATSLRMTLRRSDDAATGNFYFDDATIVRSNLLANPGFETMDSGWTNYPSANAVQDENPQSGAYNLKLWQVGGSYVDVYQQVSVTPGVTYEASVWSKTWSLDSTSRGRMRLQWYNNGTPMTTPAIPDFTSPNGDVWTQLLRSVTAPAGATHLRMTLGRAATGSGNYRFDEAKIR